VPLLAVALATGDRRCNGRDLRRGRRPETADHTSLLLLSHPSDTHPELQEQIACLRIRPLERMSGNNRAAAAVGGGTTTTMVVVAVGVSVGWRWQHQPQPQPQPQPRWSVGSVGWSTSGDDDNKRRRGSQECQEYDDRATKDCSRLSRAAAAAAGCGSENGVLSGFPRP
jgi:hypothetical protein